GLKLLIDSQPDMKVIAEAATGDAAVDQATALKPDVVIMDVIATGDAAVDQATALKPDVVIMDVSMPGLNGLLATRTLKQRQPETAIVALTRHEDKSYLEDLLRAGASAYVLKQSPPTEFLRA